MKVLLKTGTNTLHNCVACYLKLWV